MRRAAGLAADRASGRVWGGTFHSIANRLLRRHGLAVGIDPGFTVLDQADTEALIGMIRAEFGLGEQKTRFPRAETIAAVYSRTVNEQDKLDPVVRDNGSRGAPSTPTSMQSALRRLPQPASSNTRCSTTTTCSSTGGHCWTAPPPTRCAGMFDHVLVDEYQDTNRLQAEILGRLCGPRRQSHRGRRRRPGDLLVPGGFDREHPPLPRRLPGADRGHAGAELPVDPADPRRRQLGDRRLAPSSTRSNCGPPAPTAPSPTWSPAPTRPPRPTTCATWCSPTARKASPCATRRSCSVPATTPTGSSSSWPAGASHSSSTGASSSSKRPTSRTCSPCSASSTTPATPLAWHRVVGAIPGVGPGHRRPAARQAAASPPTPRAPTCCHRVLLR